MLREWVLCLTDIERCDECQNVCGNSLLINSVTVIYRCCTLYTCHPQTFNECRKKNTGVEIHPVLQATPCSAPS